MGERKGVNKYYPPDWTPAMGSLNKYHGTHALRERARKLDQGILIIRFEMPYNIWCDGCKNHIGMGVRYNAQKTKVGMYYTTTIYQFRFKCHLCDNHIEMKTDPQNLDYIVVSGARRQERRWDPTQNEQVVPEDKETSQKLATDAMYKLEHGVNDQTKSNSVAPSLARLEDRQSRWKDDYIANKILRNRFRVKKHEQAKQRELDAKLLNKSSLDIPLVPENPQDVRLAGLLRLTPLESFDDVTRNRREEIQNRPIFEDSSSTSKNSSALSKLTKDSLNIRLQQQVPVKGLTPSLLGVIVKPSKINELNVESKKTTANVSKSPDTSLQSSLVCYSDVGTSESEDNS